MKKLLNNLKEYLTNKTACILYGIALIASLLYGFIYKPLYVHFIDGLTIFGMLYFLIGVILWGQKGKIIDKNSIRLKRFTNKESFDPDDRSSYGYYNEKNRFIAPALLLLLIAFILAATF